MQETEIVNFLFEVGTMRKLPRMHRQTLMSEDMSDSIAAHSYRVAYIAWFLAKLEGADVYKTVMMALLHDLVEARTGDHNWVHKRYIKIFEDEIERDQLGSLSFPDFIELSTEYRARQSLEAIVTKNADWLDQILLLREYEMQGNQEARNWLYDRDGKAEQLRKLSLESAQKIGAEIYRLSPSDWWQHLWTSDNR